MLAFRLKKSAPLFSASGESNGPRHAELLLEPGTVVKVRDVQLQPFSIDGELVETLVMPCRVQKEDGSTEDLFMPVCVLGGEFDLCSDEWAFTHALMRRVGEEGAPHCRYHIERLNILIQVLFRTLGEVPLMQDEHRNPIPLRPS